MRGAVWILTASLALNAPDLNAQNTPLRITVVDGQVLFGGANLDVDELRAALAKAGRQSETLYFQVGPNAKSTYISQVLKAVQATGYAKLAIVGPTAPEPVLTVDPAKRFD